MEKVAFRANRRNSSVKEVKIADFYHLPVDMVGNDHYQPEGNRRDDQQDDH